MSRYSACPVFVLLILLFSSCAQQVAPTGGKPDTRPPLARKYSPDSATTHFHSKTVEIQFDEYIQLKDVSTQLVISPPMEKMPSVRVKNKTLTIEFKEPLKDSTTYTMNFGTAIQDLHENNPNVNFRYIFSTGSFVDSLCLWGQVTNALTLVPEKGVMVMLYNKLSDSVPYKQLPSYFARTDERGYYRITNIRAATYQVFALKDANFNYKYNEGEAIGFRASSLVLTHNDTANFVLFRESEQKQKLRRVSQIGHGRILLVFNKPVEDLLLKPLNFSWGEGSRVFVEKNAGGDSITYWFNSPKTDSLILEISDKGKVLDTVRYKLISYDKMLSQRKGQKASLSVRVNASKGTLDLNSPITFEFDNPVLSLGRIPDGKLLITEDTSHKNLSSKGSFHYLEKDKSLRFFSWADTAHVLKENQKYKLYILPGAFKDMFGFYNDTIRINFRTRELKFYGTLKLNLHAPEGHYVLQLLDETDAIVRESKIGGGKELYFEYLYPGKYRMRLIYDVNSNGKWDSGIYLQHLQPEHVIYNPQPVTIRSNWDQEVDWFIK